MFTCGVDRCSHVEETPLIKSHSMTYERAQNITSVEQRCGNIIWTFTTKIICLSGLALFCVVLCFWAGRGVAGNASSK